MLLVRGKLKLAESGWQCGRGWRGSNPATSLKAGKERNRPIHQTCGKFISRRNLVVEKGSDCTRSEAAELAPVKGKEKNPGRQFRSRIETTRASPSPSIRVNAGSDWYGQVQLAILASPSRGNLGINRQVTWRQKLVLIRPPDGRNVGCTIRILIAGYTERQTGDL